MLAVSSLPAESFLFLLLASRLQTKHDILMLYVLSKGVFQLEAPK